MRSAALFVVAVATLLGSCGGGGCEADGDCVSPLICASGVCRECRSDTDCEAGRTCAAMGDGVRACVFPGMLRCDASAPCDESLLCVEELCRIRCASSAECAPKETCSDGGGGMLACLPTVPPK